MEDIRFLQVDFEISRVQFFKFFTDLTDFESSPGLPLTISLLIIYAIPSGD
jgi:hypothetical protein